MLVINIPMRALSINHTHFRNRVKKPETREYEEAFLWHLSKYKGQIDEFNKEFRAGTTYSVEYIFLFNEKSFYTKKRLMGIKKTPDLDNLIKLTQDLIFSKIGNDGLIKEIRATKSATDKDDSIIILISML